jgi:ribosome biogenesis GTPase
MLLENLGYSVELENYRKEQNLDSFGIGRVISEHKERYIVKTGEGEFEGEVIGNLRYRANDRSDFPGVGDWVAISSYDEGKVLIHAVYPRKSVLERAAVGKYGEKQIIATNIDTALIIQAPDRDFNLNRIERYLTICLDAGIAPIIVLNKIDLATSEEVEKTLKQVQDRMKGVPVIALSNITRDGYDQLLVKLIKGHTYCLLGSSGVGKSTLINNLCNQSNMKTDAISETTQRGKHVTSHRHLFLLDNGALMIDNPGMREVGIADASEGLDEVFSDIEKLSQQCRYNTCTHVHESGCAVLQAVEEGLIKRSSYDNYLKMLKEKAHFESDLMDRKRKDKNLGKVLKDYKKFKKRND